MNIVLDQICTTMNPNSEYRSHVTEVENRLVERFHIPFFPRVLSYLFLNLIRDTFCVISLENKGSKSLASFSASPRYYQSETCLLLVQERLRK